MLVVLREICSKSPDHAERFIDRVGNTFVLDDHRYLHTFLHAFIAEPQLSAFRFESNFKPFMTVNDTYECQFGHYRSSYVGIVDTPSIEHAERAGPPARSAPVLDRAAGYRVRTGGTNAAGVAPPLRPLIPLVGVPV